MEAPHTDLLQQITSLSETFSDLGTRLSEAATKLLEAGTPPSESLLQELVTYRRNFTTIQKQAVELTPSLPAPSDPVSLTDLKTWVETALASQVNEEIRHKVLKILDRVVAIAHREQSDFPPLQSVHTNARELQRAISETPPTELHPDATALAEGKHPLSALLKLIEEQDKLDDEQWVTLEETVGAAFGKQLAVAISRGKLTVPAITEAPVKAETKPEPIPNVQLLVSKPKAEPIPEIIVIPTGGAVAKPTKEPEIQILESPPPATPMHEVIIIPSVEVSQQPLSVGEPTIVFGKAPLTTQLKPEPAGSERSLGLKVIVHLQGLGDRTFPAQEYAGTRGQSRRLEAFTIEIEPPISGLNIQYMAHVSGIGDTPWLNGGEWAGVRGQAKRIEGFAIRLTGPEAGNYDVFYTAHIERVGDSPAVSNGQYCGTRGKALRVEGMKVWVQRKS